MIRVEPGRTPLIISLPHAGREIPPAIAARMTPRALEVVDTDWHVERLYDFARAAGAAWLEPTLSRYVVDLNRPPDDAALYPGQVSTGLCPAATFAGEPLYTAAPPDASEVSERRRAYWQPYHDALHELIDAARRRHGHAIVLDGHSIRSCVPRLLAGRLPDLNLGTHDGRSCGPRLAAAVVAVCAGQSRFSHVLNGRFKGGYITRHYGRPAESVQALQIELAQSSYMDEAGTGYDAVRAAPLIAVLERIVATLLEIGPG